MRDAVAILLVNLLTDIAPAMAIALRPPAQARGEDLLGEGPDTSLGEALEDAIAWRATVTAAGTFAAWTGARVTGTAARAQTVALVALVGTQLGQPWSPATTARSLRPPASVQRVSWPGWCKHPG